MAVWSPPKNWGSETLTAADLNATVTSLKTFLEGGSLDRDNIETHHTFFDLPFCVYNFALGATAAFDLWSWKVPSYILNYGELKGVSAYAYNVTGGTKEIDLSVKVNAVDVALLDLDSILTLEDRHYSATLSQALVANDVIDIEKTGTDFTNVDVLSVVLHFRSTLRDSAGG